MNAKVVDLMFTLLFIIILAATVWMLLVSIADAQYCYLWQHYDWRWYKYRWVKINYPVWCCGYTCVPACRTLYGGWGPCR